MVKDNEINIKLEVCRDNNSGKLTILAHFNEDAPNIFKEKGEYFWMPTTEEKDLLNEAFELIPVNTPHITSDIPKPKPEEEMGVKAETELEPESLEEKLEKVAPIEKPDPPSVFEKTSADNTVNDDEQDVELPIEDMPPKIEEPIKIQELENPNESETDEITFEKSKENSGMMIEADSEAIEAALKKHTEKDKTIIEADEQTIVDKVLNQKKKGKWSKN